MTDPTGSNIAESFEPFETARIGGLNSKQLEKFNGSYKIPIKSRLGPKTKEFFDKKAYVTHGQSSFQESRSNSVSNLNSISIQGSINQVRKLYAGGKKNGYQPLNISFVSQIGRSLSKNQN